MRGDLEALLRIATQAARAAGAAVVELQSPILPNPLLVVAHAGLLKALVTVLVEAGAATEPIPNTAWLKHGAGALTRAADAPWLGCTTIARRCVAAVGGFGHHEWSQV